MVNVFTMFHKYIQGYKNEKKSTEIKRVLKCK